MPTLSTITPNSMTAALIAAYAKAQIAEGYGEDETPAAILLAIQQAEGAEETCHLGRALLARHDALADPPYRLGGDRCDPRLTEIAARLDYQP
jgi:hypothetical protein